MKKLLLILTFCLPLIVLSQKGNLPEESYFEPFVVQKSECLSKEGRQELNQAILENKKQILKKKPDAFNQKGGSVLFVEPIRPKAGFNDYGYHTINFLVDHNSTPNNNLLDYFCGTRTYDWASGNHGGTDYILWPYPWKRMQEELMEIVAAAPGIIVEKRDGFYDLNCLNNGNPNWNGIVLEHTDGTQTIYMHFKDGAITSKNIGDSVAEGEYLGAAGSSGSSTIPHLHFEVRDSSNNLIDPFQGSCNTMNADSKWQNQEDYYISRINRMRTLNSQTFDDQCPNVENTYEELNFESGDQLVLRLFFRDLKNGVPVDFTVTDPNGGIFAEFTWVSNWGQFYATSWGQWVWNVDNSWPDGVYNVTVDFEGNTYETIFGINTSLSVENLENNQISVFPNPATTVVNIQSISNIEQVMLFDIHGRAVMQQNLNNTAASLDVSGLKTGVYFAVIQSEGKTTTKKIIKQ